MAENDKHPILNRQPDRRPLQERLEELRARLKANKLKGDQTVRRRPFLEQGIKKQEDSGNVYPRRS